MTKAVEHNLETTESEIEQVSSDMRARLEDAVADRPIRSLLIAVVVGIVFGKLVL